MSGRIPSANAGAILAGHPPLRLLAAMVPLLLHQHQPLRQLQPQVLRQRQRQVLRQRQHLHQQLPARSHTLPMHSLTSTRLC